MGWLSNWLTSSAPWFANPLTIWKTPSTLWITSKMSSWSQERQWHLMMSRHSSPQFQWTPSITIVKCKLQQDPLLSQRTNMSTPQIVSHLEFCLKNTYFLFTGDYYEQVLGAAMGCPISPLIVNLFMEELKVKAISSFQHNPCVWLRFLMTLVSSNR